MTTAIIAFGVRGDIQPYFALAAAMRRAGLPVRLVSDQRYAWLARQHDVPFYPAPVDFQAALDSPIGQKVMRYNRVGDILAYHRTAVLPQAQRAVQTSWQAVQGCERIVYSNLSVIGGELGQKLGIPAIPAMNIPSLPTGAFAVPQGDLPNLGTVFNRFSYRALVGLIWLIYRPEVNRLRSELLGLPAVDWHGPDWFTRSQPLTLGVWSQSLVTTPKDWPPEMLVTGYWFLPTELGFNPPAELAAFLANGPRPVYIGFGSMTASNQATRLQNVLDALKQVDCRAVLHGFPPAVQPEQTRTSDRVFYLKGPIAHDWLFPQMAAVIHHGGPGTTSSGLLAGQTTICIPQFADQFFWGRRVQASGAGPAPLPLLQVNAERLAQRIRAALEDETYRSNALRIANIFHSEDGVNKAIKAIMNVKA